ncbi:hypothetical protein AB0G02_32995, partial [Actinosynnema sp. NPDC023658]
LLRWATLSAMTEQKVLLVVEIDEGADHLAAALVAGGLDVRRENRVLTIRLGEDSGAVYDLIRDAVADLDLSLHRLERQRHQVADLFRDRPAQEVSHV